MSLTGINSPDGRESGLAFLMVTERDRGTVRCSRPRRRLWGAAPCPARGLSLLAAVGWRRSGTWERMAELTAFRRSAEHVELAAGENRSLEQVGAQLQALLVQPIPLAGQSETLSDLLGVRA